MENVLDSAIRQLDSNEQELVTVNDPTSVHGATTDVDQELYKLMLNMQVLAELKKIAGEESVRLEQQYNKCALQYANTLTAERLTSLGIVRSDKFKYIKMLLHEKYALVEL
jgi:hypothetical protein